MFILLICIILYIILGLLYNISIVECGVPEDKIRKIDAIFWIAHFIVLFFLCIGELAYYYLTITPHNRYKDIIKVMIISYYTDSFNY